MLKGSNFLEGKYSHMQRKLKIGFKHCGNCNPHIKTSTLQNEVKELIKYNGHVEICSKDDPDMDFLIVLSGCPVDCAERTIGEFSEIIVPVDSVNDKRYNFDIIFEKINRASCTSP